MAHLFERRAWSLDGEPLRLVSDHPKARFSLMRRQAGDQLRDCRISRFARLLYEHRRAAGKPGTTVAREAGVNPSYLTRIENGDRDPPARPLVESLARALDVAPVDQSDFYAAAGLLPPVVTQIGEWPQVLDVVCGVLADEAIPEDEKREFRRTIVAIARRWRPLEERGFING